MNFEIINQWHTHNNHTQVIVDSLPNQVIHVLRNFKCCIAGGYIRSFYDGTLGKYSFFVKDSSTRKEDMGRKFSKLMSSGTDIDIFAESKGEAENIIKYLKSELKLWSYENGKKSSGTSHNSTYADFNINNLLVKIQIVYRWDTQMLNQL